jgi:hypothetical protein
MILHILKQVLNNLIFPNSHKTGELLVNMKALYGRLVSIRTMEEGRAASKGSHKNFGYFLSTSQQEVSADIIPNSAVGIFSPKTEGTKT